MRGRRRADKPKDDWHPDCQPGDYWLKADGTFHIVTPNGLHGWLKNHKVIVNEDGTITVPLNDNGKANSILVSNGTGIAANKDSWHGSIERGVWIAC